MTGSGFTAGVNVRAMFVVHNPSLVGVTEKTGRLELVQRRCHAQRTRFALKSSAAWSSGNPARRRWVYEQSKRQAEETIKKAEEVRRQQEELARALEPRSSSPAPPPPTSTVRDVSHLEAARKVIEANRQAAQRAAEMAKAKGSASTTGTPAESRTAQQTGAVTTSERSAAAQRAASPAEAAPPTRDKAGDGASAAQKPTGTAAASPSSGAAAADKSGDSAASSRSTRSTPSSSGAATADKSSGSAAPSTPASPAPPASQSRGERSAEGETPGGPPGAKASATTDGPAKATQHRQQPDVSMAARSSTPGLDRSGLGRLNGKEFRSVSAAPDASNTERFEFPKKVITSTEPADERSTRPSAADWGVPSGSMSSASPSSLRGAAVPIHTKIDTPAPRSNTSASGNSAADLERQEQTHSFATKEAFRVVGQATPTSAQSDAKQTHNKPDPIGAYTPPAAPLTDKDHDERVAPKGFGAYIRRIGREQNGMPENDVSSSFGARRAQHPEEEPTADRPMHRGGESPVPSARLHTNRSPTMSSDTSPSTVTLGSRDSVEDLEHKVLHHLNTGKLAALTVPQLRAFLQQQKMPSAGKKKELIHEIERWWQAAHQQKH